MNTSHAAHVGPNQQRIEELKPHGRHAATGGVLS